MLLFCLFSSKKLIEIILFEDTCFHINVKLASLVSE